jgi:hypothetical protein
MSYMVPCNQQHKSSTLKRIRSLIGAQSHHVALLLHQYYINYMLAHIHSAQGARNYLYVGMLLLES